MDICVKSDIFNLAFFFARLFSSPPLSYGEFFQPKPRQTTRNYLIKHLFHYTLHSVESRPIHMRMNIIFLSNYFSRALYVGLFIFIYLHMESLAVGHRKNKHRINADKTIFYQSWLFFCFLRFVVIFYFPAALDFCSRLIIGEMKLRFQPDGWDIKGGRHGHKQITLRQSAEAA